MRALLLRLPSRFGIGRDHNASGGWGPTSPKVHETRQIEIVPHRLCRCCTCRLVPNATFSESRCRFTSHTWLIKGEGLTSSKCIPLLSSSLRHPSTAGDGEGLDPKFSESAMPRESGLSTIRRERGSASTKSVAGHRASSADGATAFGQDMESWSTSTTTQFHLTDLVKQGFLPPRSALLWVSTKNTEEVAKPNSWNRVIDTSFLCRGLSLSLHNFVPSLLVFYTVSSIISRRTESCTCPVLSPCASASWGSRRISGFALLI